MIETGDVQYSPRTHQFISETFTLPSTIVPQTGSCVNKINPEVYPVRLDELSRVLKNPFRKNQVLMINYNDQWGAI